MYINFVLNRKDLNYQALKDCNCGIKLVKVSKNLKNKSRRVVVIISLTTLFSFSHIKSAEAMGFTLPAKSIIKVEHSSNNPTIKIQKTIYCKPDRIRYASSNRSTENLMLFIYSIDLKNKYILQLIKEYRSRS